MTATQDRRDPAASMSLLSDLMRDAVHSDYDEDAPAARPRPGWTVLAGVVAAGTAAILAVAGVQARDTASASAVQRQALLDRVESATADNLALDHRVRALRSDVEDAQAAAVADTVTGQALAERAESLAGQAQYTEVSGPGTRITLDDAEDAAPDSTDLGRVLDRDLQMVVNGLWQAGAGAVAVNDHRLSARTAIRSAGGAILVDYRPLRPPYRVTAVGDADLQARFESGPAGEDLRGLGEDYGLRWSVEPAEVTLPPADSALPQFARVPEEVA